MKRGAFEAAPRLSGVNSAQEPAGATVCKQRQHLICTKMLFLQRAWQGLKYSAKPPRARIHDTPKIRAEGDGFLAGGMHASAKRVAGQGTIGSLRRFFSSFSALSQKHDPQAMRFWLTERIQRAQRVGHSLVERKEAVGDWTRQQKGREQRVSSGLTASQTAFPCVLSAPHTPRRCPLLWSPDRRTGG